MSEAYKDTSVGWAKAVRRRRKALVQRLGLAAATALIFSPLFGWPLSVGWVAGYFLIQLMDLVVFAPINKGAERMGPARTLAGLVLLFLNGLAFGSLSLPLWVIGGPMGGICAAVLLAAGAIYAVVNSPRSRTVLALSLTPHMLYFLAIPLFMVSYGAPAGFVTAVAVAVTVFCGYCVSVWQKMTEADQSEAAARLDADRRRIEAERAMTSRSQFLAAVGHDLRTPISAILTGASELERGAGDATARAHAALITDAGLMMKAMLDDLLDHSKLDAGRMTVEVSDFDMRALLCQTLKLWKGPVEAKGLMLRVEGAHRTPAHLRGDPMRIRQILNNLISNAVKFTETGAITLRLSAWAEEPASYALLIEVADSGPGMTAEQLGRLFTPFDQTAEGINARHGGTGLGLAISRDLAGLMGGRLTARSAPGQGAAFTLSLNLAVAQSEVKQPPRFNEEDRGDIVRALAAKPVVRPQSPAPEPMIDATPAPSVEPDEEPTDSEDRPLRVLVVDDHEINRRAIELILLPLGCDISSAADGLAALALCETKSFDVVFMDVRMPELDGRETTRRLRGGSTRNAQVPVIAVTADTSPDDIAACMGAGMTYFVSKPLTPQTLLGALSEVLSGDGAEAEAEPATAVA